MILALKLHRSMETMLKLIHIGEHELTMVNSEYFETGGLQLTCLNENMSLDIVSKSLQ